MASTNTVTNLRICSYNMHGFSNGLSDASNTL